MKSQRLRPLMTAMGAIVLVWVLAGAGYWIARNSKMTPEKIQAYVQSVDFAKLSAEERYRALLALAAKLNAVPRDDRRQAHWNDLWRPWFKQMTDAEKEEFVNATLPNDVKQMLSAFEQMTPEKRKKTVDQAIFNMRQNAERQPSDSSTNDISATNNIARLSPEATQRMETLGLKTFYSESSAEAKAELAPLLEEMQHQMENGHGIR